MKCVSRCKRCDRVDVFADNINGLYWAFFWYRGKRFGWTSLHSAECFGTMERQIDEYLGDYFLWVADDRTRMLEQRDHARESYEWYLNTHSYHGTYLRRQGYTEWHFARLDQITQRRKG